MTKLNKFIIFDLDDTLYQEIDYLKSAYLEIAKTIDCHKSHLILKHMVKWYEDGINVFDHLINLYPDLKTSDLLNIYRNHYPTISLNKNVIEILKICKENSYKLGVITDGRSVTQRNKLKALGIETFFDKIIISEEIGSEKPNENNFKIFIENNIKEYIYIGDNPKKDFITPNKLGWKTVCVLDHHKNIHPQDFNIDSKYLPSIKIKSFEELKNII